MTSNTKKNLNICIVAHFAYGAMTGGSSGHIGGVERQTSFMARWLAARGHKVSLVTWDEGQPDSTEIDGVRILKVCKQDEGVRGIRFIHPRWTSLNKALRKADADIYYQNCGEYVTGQVAMWCRKWGRKFIYSVASDADCDGRLPQMTKLYERLLYRHGIRNTNRIIVQTQTQQEMLNKYFGLRSIVIPMPCPGPIEKEFMSRRLPGIREQRILWVAKFTKQKRPDRFIELVKRCPDLKFDMIGPVYESDYTNSILDQSKELSNLTIHGAVPRDRIKTFYENSVCLCCTSDQEGFPNTYLEAWSYGLPIVSTFDPDCLIAEKGLGKVAADVTGLEKGIRMLLESPDLWQAVSFKARQYYLENHSIDRVMPLFEQAFSGG